MYPRMTSSSDPKGFIQTVTMFHIKAEFLCWIIVVRHFNFQMISRKKMERLNIEFWRSLFWEPLFSLTVSKWTSFSDLHSFSKQVEIWSWLLLLKIETHKLNMETYWKQGLHIVIKKKIGNIKIMETLSKQEGGVIKWAKTCMQITCIQIFFVVLYIKHSG